MASPHEYTARFGTGCECWIQCSGSNANKIELCLRREPSVTHFVYNGCLRRYNVTHHQAAPDAGVIMTLKHHEKYQGSRHDPIAIRRIKSFCGSVKYKKTSRQTSCLCFEVTNSISGLQIDHLIQVEKNDHWGQLCRAAKRMLIKYDPCFSRNSKVILLPEGTTKKIHGSTKVRTVMKKDMEKTEEEQG